MIWLGNFSRSAYGPCPKTWTTSWPGRWSSHMPLEELCRAEIQERSCRSLERRLRLSAIKSFKPLGTTFPGTPTCGSGRQGGEYRHTSLQAWVLMPGTAPPTRQKWLECGEDSGISALKTRGTWAKSGLRSPEFQAWSAGVARYFRSWLHLWRLTFEGRAGHKKTGSWAYQIELQRPLYQTDPSRSLN